MTQEQPYAGPERRSYEDGRVDAQLASHEQRLNAINGSIDRSAKRQEQLATEVRKNREEVTDEIRNLGDRVADLAAEQRTRIEIDRALVDQHREATEAAKNAEETKLGRLQAVLTIVGTFAAIVGVIVAALTLLKMLAVI